MLLFAHNLDSINLTKQSISTLIYKLLTSILKTKYISYYESV